MDMIRNPAQGMYLSPLSHALATDQRVSMLFNVSFQEGSALICRPDKVVIEARMDSSHLRSFGKEANTASVGFWGAEPPRCQERLPPGAWQQSVRYTRFLLRRDRRIGNGACPEGTVRHRATRFSA